jgi:opacity protein-like surface antigen
MRLALVLVVVSSSMALAQPEKPAEATEPVTTPSSAFGVLFNLQNVFQNPGLLSGFQGGIGVQFGLNERMAIRPTLSMSRTANAATVTEVTTVANDMTTTTRTFTRPQGPTATFGLTLGGDFLYQLLQTALTPYLGGGLFVNYASAARAFRDDTQMDQVTSVNDLTTSFGLGVRGILGVAWRVHPHFALFAEYSLLINVFSSQQVNTSTEVTAMGQTAAMRTSTPSSKVFEFSTGLSQGASLGVVAFF